MAERSFALIKTDTIGLKTFILGQTKITCIANKNKYLARTTLLCDNIHQVLSKSKDWKA